MLPPFNTSTVPWPPPAAGTRLAGSRWRLVRYALYCRLLDSPSWVFFTEIFGATALMGTVYRRAEASSRLPCHAALRCAALPLRCAADHKGGLALHLTCTVQLGAATHGSRGALPHPQPPPYTCRWLGARVGEHAFLGGLATTCHDGLDLGDLTSSGSDSFVYCADAEGVVQRVRVDALATVGNSSVLYPGSHMMEVR